MTEVKKNDSRADTVALLQNVYKNIKMASDSILNLMPKVTDKQFKSDLTIQLSAYDAFASRTAKLLEEVGGKPKEEGTVAKVSAKMGVMMNTMKDSSTAHLCEMMVEGATMGVNDLLHQLRECENSGVSESALRLARDICQYEEKTLQEMKDNYLRPAGNC